MYKQESRKSMRKTALTMDVVNIIIGLVIVALAVVSFLNPKNHMFLLPVIFFLGAALNVMNGIHGFHRSGREMKKKASAVAQCAGGLVLLGICALSVFSIWWI